MGLDEASRFSLDAAAACSRERADRPTLMNIAKGDARAFPQPCPKPRARTVRYPGAGCSHRSILEYYYPYKNIVHQESLPDAMVDCCDVAYSCENLDAWSRPTFLVPIDRP